MAGDTAPDAASAKALWDEVTQEREAGTPPSTPEVVEAPEVIAETTPETTPETTAPAASTDTPDPFAGLSPAVRARLEKLDALETQLAVIPQLSQSLRTAEGRVAALQREMDAAKAAAKVTTAPTTAQIEAAGASTKKWDELRGDFPEWAEATEQFVKASLSGLTAKQVEGMTPEAVEALVQQRLQAERASTTEQIEHAKVEGKYESWKEVINTPQFVEWYGKQPQEIRALGASPQGRDAIKLLDTYHEAIAAPAAKVQEARKNRLQAAVTARPGAAATATAKTVDQMSQQELWEHERKQSARKHAGLTY